MAARNLEQGIQAIRGGHMTEGSRLLRIALRDATLPANLRAIGLMWLAQTTQNRDEQIAYYREAVQADPGNADAQQGLGALLAPGMPSANDPSAAAQQDNTNAFWIGDNYPPQQGDTGPLPRQNNYGQGNNYNSQRGDTGPLPRQGGYGQGDFGQQSRPQRDPRPGQQQGFDNFGNPPPQQNPYGQGDFGQQSRPQRDPRHGQQQGFDNFGNPPPQQNPYGQGDFGQPQRDARPGQPGFDAFGNQQQQPRDPFGANATANNYTNPQDPFGQGQNAIFDTGQFVPSYGQAASSPSNAPIILRAVQRSVGIVGGPNGIGTGFFVTRSGIIATTRHVVGGEEQVEIHLMDGQRTVGQVVRSFPDLDLAFVQTNVQLAGLMETAVSQNIPDNTPLVAVAHPSKGMRSSKRATRHAVGSHWFPTLINHLRDAGGNPVFTDDGNNVLLGMLTKNLTRSNGYMYALHISKIMEMLQRYVQERQQAGRSTYCFACGNLSRAAQYGGFYCETCGNTLSYAINITRYPQPNLVALYGEDVNRPCPNCDSTVGFSKGSCMRCGYQLR